eukprot:scaffold11693_cov154-Amphora_coffeaeformis.AAC.2
MTLSSLVCDGNLRRLLKRINYISKRLSNFALVRWCVSTFKRYKDTTLEGDRYGTSHTFKDDVCDLMHEQGKDALGASTDF